MAVLNSDIRQDPRLLIADKDPDSARQLADLLDTAGYSVTITDSAADALDGILKRTAQVVLLGNEVDHLSAAQLIPLLKQCNRDLCIILISDEASLPAIRKVRREGIFYHALRPVKDEDREEIRQVVECAVENLAQSGKLATHTRSGKQFIV